MNVEPNLMSTLIPILMGYQGQLSQIAMALLSGSAVLLYANRRKKKILPIVLTLIGGALAATAAFKGIGFTEAIANSSLTNNIDQNKFASGATCQLTLMVFAAIALAFGSLTSEYEK